MALQQRYLDTQDTIAAQASAVGSSLRGIIRITGIATFDLIKKLFHANDQCWNFNTKTPCQYAVSLNSTNLQNKLPISLYWWPTGKSFTGQPLAELHLCGAPPLINHVLSEIYTLGARPANPGEFTLRAFLNGKLDLVQAEAVLGVIDARTDDELDQALSQLAGGISHQLKELRSDLLNDLADLEAGLDFVDEDLDFISRHEFTNRLELGIKLAQDLLLVSNERMTSRTHPKVVLAGLPNAGKSTLFNTHAERSEAIVSPIKGTTRDYLSAIITINSLSIELIDTAGIDDLTTGADRSGQAFSEGQIQAADLVVWCRPSKLDSQDVADNDYYFSKLQQSEIPVIKVITKIDLIKDSLPISEIPAEVVGISTIDQTGIAAFKSMIHRELSAQQNEHAILISATAARCQDALHKTIDALTQAKSWLHDAFGDEMIALEIRSALESLGEITGEVYTNDLLDRIFSRFCIGK